MRQRVRTGILVLMVICLVLGMTGTAMATTWKKVKPSAKFMKYAKHAKAHDVEVWYPSRVPAGYKLSSVRSGTRWGFPYCDVVFKSGKKRLELSQDAVSAADGERLDSPYYDEKMVWGSSYGYRQGSGVSWWGGHSTHTERGVLSRSGGSNSVLRGVAKRLKTVPLRAVTVTWTGYLMKWTPRGNASATGTTKIVGKEPMADYAEPAFVSSNAKTRFYYERDGEGWWGSGSPVRVTRDKFFALTQAHEDSEQAVSSVDVKWIWKRDSRGRLYRRVQSITGSSTYWGWARD